MIIICFLDLSFFNFGPFLAYMEWEFTLFVQAMIVKNLFRFISRDHLFVYSFSILLQLRILMFLFFDFSLSFDFLGLFCILVVIIWQCNNSKLLNHFRLRVRICDWYFPTTHISILLFNSEVSIDIWILIIFLLDLPWLYNLSLIIVWRFTRVRVILCDKPVHTGSSYSRYCSDH